LKVVDAFGCGLPVVAARYDALSELVVEEDSVEAVIEGVEPNGVTFEDAEELCARLTETLRGWWDGGDDDNGDGGGDDDSGDDDDDREGVKETATRRARGDARGAMGRELGSRREASVRVTSEERSIDRSG
jgi:glycosyltransferase involved in cell wall biosynthesis